MKQLSMVLLAVPAVSLAVLLTGCGPSGPSLAPTTVTVKHNGEPVEGASVSFVSAENPSHVASGTTDASGKATLQTDGKAGAPIGKNNVGVAKGGGVMEDRPASLEEAKKRTMMTPDGAKMKDMKSKSELPAKYANPGSSGLSYDVKSGSNDFTIELTGDGGAAGGSAPAGDAKSDAPSAEEKK